MRHDSEAKHFMRFSMEKGGCIFSQYKYAYKYADHTRYHTRMRELVDVISKTFGYNLCVSGTLHLSSTRKLLYFSVLR